jgi:long-chain fatty acid transport protein
MKNNHSLKINFLTKTILSGLIASTFLSSNSFAAAYSSNMYSASGISTSYAGSATGLHDASDMFFNAANLSDLNSSQAILSLSYLDLRIDGDNLSSFDSSGNQVSGADVQDAGLNSLVPSFYLALPINDKATFGFAVTTPFGLATKYNDESLVSSYATESNVVTNNFNPTISYKVNDNLNLAIGAQVQYYKASLGKNLNSLGYAKSRGSDWGYGYTLGATYKINDKAKVGLGYRSKIDHKVEGTTNIYSDSSLSTGFNLNTTTPESADLGVSYKVNDKATIAYDLIWTRWSRVNDITVRNFNSLGDDVTTFKWHDSFMHAIGLNYEHCKKLTLRTGLAFEKEGMSNATLEARIPAGDRYWTSLGFNYKITDSFSIDASYVHQFFEKVSVSTDASTYSNSVSGNFKTKVDVYSIAIKKDF